MRPPRGRADVPDWSHATAGRSASESRLVLEVGEPILEVVDLHVTFETRAGLVHAVDGLHYSLFSGETLGILGESGSGKSVSALAIMGLLESPPARVFGEGVFYRGLDVLRASRGQMRSIRGDKIAMIFQDPSTSLDPAFSVGFQIGEVLRIRQGWSRSRARRRVTDFRLES